IGVGIDPRPLAHGEHDLAASLQRLRVDLVAAVPGSGQSEQRRAGVYAVDTAPRGDRPTAEAAPPGRPEPVVVAPSPVRALAAAAPAPAALAGGGEGGGGGAPRGGAAPGGPPPRAPPVEPGDRAGDRGPGAPGAVALQVGGPSEQGAGGQRRHRGGPPLVELG